MCLNDLHHHHQCDVSREEDHHEVEEVIVIEVGGLHAIRGIISHQGTVKPLAMEGPPHHYLDLVR